MIYRYFNNIITHPVPLKRSFLSFFLSYLSSSYLSLLFLETFFQRKTIPRCNLYSRESNDQEYTLNYWINPMTEISGTLQWRIRIGSVAETREKERGVTHFPSGSSSIVYAKFNLYKCYTLIWGSDGKRGIYSKINFLASPLAYLVN